MLMTNKVASMPISCGLCHCFPSFCCLGRVVDATPSSLQICGLWLHICPVRKRSSSSVRMDGSSEWCGLPQAKAQAAGNNTCATDTPAETH